MSDNPVYRRMIQGRNKTIINNAKRDGCVLCGYNKCLDAIEFHHVGDKSFSLSKVRQQSVRIVKNELSKCIVVCANCHREIHAGKIDGYEDYNKTEELPLLQIINGGVV